MECDKFTEMGFHIEQLRRLRRKKLGLYKTTDTLNAQREKNEVWKIRAIILMIIATIGIIIGLEEKKTHKMNYKPQDSQTEKSVEKIYE